MVIIARSRNDNGCWTIRGRVVLKLTPWGKLFPAFLALLDDLAPCFGFEAEVA